MKEIVESTFFKFLYWYISTIDKNAEITFMNYGYSKNKDKITLDNADEKNRYSAQLYNHVATGVDLENKDILEIGCGRGGGLSYINRYLSPKSATGLDLNKKAIEFCNNYYLEDTISFVQGNAQELDFEDNAFDVVLNVESSHRYAQMDKFLFEVNRVLKPGGYFLFTDFRPESDLEKLDTQLTDANLEFVSHEVITSNVLEALDMSNEERERLIQNVVPKLMRGVGKQFAATEGTPTYNKFLHKEFEYLFKILRKKE